MPIDWQGCCVRGRAVQEAAHIPVRIIACREQIRQRNIHPQFKRQLRMLKDTMPRRSRYGR